LATFADDFERADGALGGNWIASHANVGIVGGWASCSAGVTWFAYDTTLAGSSSRVKATARVNLPSGATWYNGPAVKINTASNTGYSAFLAWSGGIFSLKIGKGALTGLTVLATGDLPYMPPGVYSIGLEWNDGHITATIAGLVTVEADDGDYAQYNGLGMRGYYNAQVIASVVLEDGDEPTFTVTPSPIGNYGSTVQLAFTGTETTWDTTDPTFTVGNGSLSDITITSDTTATATYDPGTFLGTTTFTDPSTAATDDVLVTSDPALVPPTGTQFSAEAIAYIERSAIAEASPTIANRDMVVSESGPSITLSSGVNMIRLGTLDKTYAPGGDAGANALAYLLWQLVNGGYDPVVGPWPEPPDTPIAQNVGAILTALDTLITVNDYTLGDVITTLAGEGVPTHKSIMDAVGELDAPDLQPVLDAIAALRGDAVSTVKALADQLDTIRSIGDYTLASVKTWVEAVRGTDQPTVKDVLTAIAALNDAPPADLGPVLTAVAAVDVDTSSLIATLAAFLVPELATVQMILDAIEAIEVAPASTGNAPIWPGIENVTLGTPVALVTGTVIDGPMDGVLIHIDSAPSGAGLYLFGAVKSYTHAGSIMFGTDNGDWEFPAKIAVEDHVICPRIMISAGTAKLRVNTGFAGTVTPWTKTL
jgi:hypothetical protein